MILLLEDKALHMGDDVLNMAFLLAQLSTFKITFILTFHFIIYEKAFWSHDFCGQRYSKRASFTVLFLLSVGVHLGWRFGGDDRA